MRSMPVTGAAPVTRRPRAPERAFFAGALAALFRFLGDGTRQRLGKRRGITRDEVIRVAAPR
jgi:hypothetical protein